MHARAEPHAPAEPHTPAELPRLREGHCRHPAQRISPLPWGTV
jgi:hypothetical protein